ncbi:MAG TPA: TonB-dependent receptor [Caulobacteraceae bacterium]|nr:TonB-dependent receptor [Caulobacteraceae bacterium]
MGPVQSGASWLALAIACAGAAVPGLAAAQSASAPNPKAAATQVQELVVTAMRREELLSRVTASVQAFTAAKMDVQGIKSFADIAKFTPGVTYQADRHDVYIRGIESTAGSGTTGIYIDDTPIQVRALGFNANNALPTVFDLDRVEVLRGPQGTLFGAGSEGGTVRYITAQPSFTNFSGFAHTELADVWHGSPDYELGAAMGGPLISDKLAFRISAWGRHDGGYIDRVDYQTLDVTQSNANYTDTYVLRGALAMRLPDNITVTTAVNYQNRLDHALSEYTVAVSNPDRGIFRDVTPDIQPDKDHFWLPSIKVEWDGPGVNFISNTAYYDRSEKVGGYSGTIYDLSYFQHFTVPAGYVDQFGFPQTPTYGYPSDPEGNPCANNCTAFYPLLLPTGPNAAVLGPLANYVASNLITNTQENFSQEFRLQSANSNARLVWVAGAFFSYDAQRSTEEIRDPQLPALTQYLWGENMATAWGDNLLPNGDDYINDTLAHDRQYALFADATFAITPQLKVDGGVRYAWTHFDFRNFNGGAQDLLCGSGVTDCPFNTTSGSKDEHPFTPRGSISYQITDDDMVYATVAKGYRIGGAVPPLPIPACGPTPFPTSYNSDSVWSYEVGTKDRFFDRRLYVAASAYWIDWSNIQQAFYVPLCGIQFTTNAGNATSKGFDAQFQASLAHGLEVEGAVGYTHARFTNTAMDANGDVLTVKGDSLDVAPWTVTLGGQYDFQLLSRDAFVRADWEYKSKRTAAIPAEDPNSAFYDAGVVPNPATNLVSLRAGMTFGRVDVELYCNNLLDAHPQLNLSHQDQETLMYEAETLRPRTVGFSATIKY